MIATRLVGGLGNQMFQYAVGRALALRRGVDVYVDRTAFSDYKVHAYGLNHFALNALDVPGHLTPSTKGLSLFRHLLKRMRGEPSLRWIKERAFTFDPEVLLVHDGAYLDGYWQSEKYFSDFADFIRADFKVVTPLSAITQSWLAEISESHAVSLHVRRGDYVSVPSANQFHGTCSLEYYRLAMEEIAQLLSVTPKFFVFSDDLEWVKEHLDFGDFQHAFVMGNGAERNYEDLLLMSACQHQIIANSTFSWWGAWLNPNVNKVVVAPRQWFANPDISARDLIPDAWHLL